MKRKYIITTTILISLLTFIGISQADKFITKQVTDLDLDETRSLLLDDCNTIPMLDYSGTNTEYIDYYSRLFKSVDNKITYSSSINFFVDPSGKHLSIYTIELDRSGTEYLPDLYCFIALVKNSETSGYAAYEATNGHIKTLEITNSPELFQ